MPQKICYKCKECKPASDSPVLKTGRLHSYCTLCRRSVDRENYKKNRSKIRVRQAKYRDENRERVNKQKKNHYVENAKLILERNKLWRERNKDKVRANQRLYVKTEKGREVVKKSGKKYREKNKEKYRLWQKEWRKSEKGKSLLAQRRSCPKNKLYRSVLGSIYGKLKRVGARKRKSLTDSLPYSLTDLKIHLESKFLPGMTWDNYGIEGWHIDHIVPHSNFEYDSLDHSDFLACWALENLQPMWAKDNISKGNKDWGLWKQSNPRGGKYV